MAANRCPDCNKFVSTELGEPEVDDVTIEETSKGKGWLTATLKLSKVCAECGTELATKEMTIEQEIDLTGFEEVC